MSGPNVETLRGKRIALRPLPARASQRRTLDERLSVLFPRVYRLLTQAVSRLTPRSRLRRFLVVRRVQRAYAAVNRRDFDLVLVGWDQGSEYRPSRDLMPPDAEPVFYGHGGMRQLWRYWLEAFHDLAWEPEEIIDFGDALVVSAQQRGTGSGSGVAVSKPVFQVFTLRDGMVLRQEDFLDRSDALETVRGRDRGLELAEAPGSTDPASWR